MSSIDLLLISWKYMHLNIIKVIRWLYLMSPISLNCACLSCSCGYDCADCSAAVQFLISGDLSLVMGRTPQALACWPAGEEFLYGSKELSHALWGGCQIQSCSLVVDTTGCCAKLIFSWFLESVLPSCAGDHLFSLTRCLHLSVIHKTFHY